MNKKETILSAALVLLTSKGIHATPMSAIAQKAGTGMGTIYNYFPNKEALVNAIYVDIKQKEKTVFSVFESDKPIKTQFELYYTQVIQFFIENPLFFQFMEQLQASPIITKDSRELGIQAINSVIELVEKGKKQRVIKELPTSELMQFIGGTIISYLKLHFDGNAQNDPSLGNQLRMVWDAVKE